ncbi:helix-hairpin-helix domain-containing protein [Roseomonas sp. E05]|uniref:helix-hairpin-helix domain-containing protein n=1 Tax=Roseomonas sp. E05 TaxID=3046310 RepID=UPI0024B9B884|nr:helix-hairpin-helix domain-containing protein [Roseomonas sp. E05]MDJ0390112.1 helix-hairpin-helix domain-containing protein [Roseomonas sp. E05]
MLPSAGAARSPEPFPAEPSAGKALPPATIRNEPIAERLREAADLLLAQGDGPFRAAAYRRAAEAVLALPRELGVIAAEGGRPALEAIPGLGPAIASAIAEMLATGRWAYLERLRGVAEPEQLFCLVPGIGHALARRIHEALHLETLEALEVAAHDGRLANLAGFGPRRAAVVRAALTRLLGRLRSAPPRAAGEPPVPLLLDVDGEYRQRSACGDLPRIAPRRFNPSGEAWLPVLHTRRGDWHFTALYSNSALAHRLGKARDWVVAYFHREGFSEGQRTVVSESRGDARGQRIVRGREAECVATAPTEHAGGTKAGPARA